MTRQNNSIDAIRGRHAARQVWLLVSIGLACGFCVLGLFGLMVWHHNDVRSAQMEKQGGIAFNLAEMNSGVLGELHQLSNVLSGNESYIHHPENISRLESYVTELGDLCVASQQIAHIAGLRQAIEELASFEIRVKEWSQARQATQQACLEQRDSVRGRMQRMRHALSRGYGRARLERVLAARAFLEPAKAGSIEDAKRVVRGTLCNDPMLLIADFAELELLVERLIYENRLDQLMDIKDNCLSVALSRMRAELHRRGDLNDQEAADFLEQLEACEADLFGVGYVNDAAHQTMVPGIGGLYSLCQRQLALVQQSLQLLRHKDELSSRFNRARDQVLEEVDALLQRQSMAASAEMRNALLGCGAGMLLASVLFVSLGRKIARTVTRQMTDLEIKFRQLDEAVVMLRALRDREQKAREEQEVLNRRLHLAKKQADDMAERAAAASEAKSQFLANMSHEIRTPMTAILGFADILKTDEGFGLTKQQREDAISTIQRNGAYLLGLINDILDLSKIESGKLEVENIECSPAQIAGDVLALMEGRAAGKGLTQVLRFSGPVPRTIHSDPTRLRQVLINLVGNALKFTEHGGVEVRVEFVARPIPSVKFHVKDTGIGISEDQLQRLFVPFAQADNSTTRKYGGTGLGLAISKRLAEMLHGELTVESAEGHGSTFVVTLPTGSLEGVPMDDAQQSQEIAGRAKVVAAPATRSDIERALADKRILLAEDGPDNQRIISMILRKSGAEVTIAANGAVALELALAARQDERPYDLILMDMAMPVLDGYAATKRLRSLDYRGPIIALTAHAMKGDDDKCLQAGCDGYATKPIERRQLIEQIARTIAEHTEAEHAPHAH